MLILDISYDSICFIQALHNADAVTIGIFENLVKLVIGLDSRIGWLLLPTLFDKMPNLERITFMDVSFCVRNTFFAFQWLIIGIYLFIIIH